MSENEYLEFKSLLKLWNSITGPITSAVVYEPHSFRLPFFSSMAGHYSLEHILAPSRIRNPTVPQIRVPAGGKGMDLYYSIAGALGEAIERVLAVLYYLDVYDKIIYSTYNELTKKGILALGPKELPLFAEWQYRQPSFEFSPFREDSLIGWVEGHYLIGKDRVLVPAQVVLMYYKIKKREEIIGYPTTGGLVFRHNENEAITHGIIETIERDAINLRWCCNLPFPRINLNEIELPGNRSKSETVLRKFRNIDIRYASVDISEVAVVVALEYDENREAFAFTSGGAGSLSTRDAIISAIGEIGQTSNTLNYVQLSESYRRFITPDTRHKELREFLDALVYYGYSKNLHNLRNRLHTNETIDFSKIATTAPANEYKAVIDILKKHNMDAIILDFAASTLKSYPIRKVFIPQLTQAFVPANPLLGHPRFYNMPKLLGYKNRDIKFSELSQDPVPLP